MCCECKRIYISCILYELYKQTDCGNKYSPGFPLQLSPGFLVNLMCPRQGPPPALRPMVADVLKKEEPGGDDNNVEEKL